MKIKKLSHAPITESVEIFVLEGVYANEFGSFKKGTYLKLPKEQLDKVFCTTSCKIFKKSNYNTPRKTDNNLRSLI